MCVVAEFSVDQSSYNVSELDGGVEVCVILTGDLDRQITLELILSNRTADARDYDSSSLVYTFTPVSETTVCNRVAITNDSVVEDREQFMVELQQNPEDRAVIIDRSVAEIFIDDFSIGCKCHV